MYRLVLALLIVAFSCNLVFAAMSEEQKRFQKSNYFSGGATKPTIIKKAGKGSLSVSSQYLDNLRSNLGESNVNKVHPTTAINVDYDEIWESYLTSGLSKTEIRKFRSQLNKIRTYWKDGNIQASVVLKQMKYNGKVNYVITEIQPRREALTKM